MSQKIVSIPKKQDNTILAKAKKKKLEQTKFDLRIR